MPSPVHPYSDYGVALRTLRSARSWLGLTMVVCVVVQFVGFALMWWTPQPYEAMKAQWRPAPTALSRSLEEFRTWLTASQPAPTTAARELPPVFYPGTDDSHRLNVRKQWATTYTICVPLTQIASLIAVSSQAIILFVTLLVVLVAQAPGVAQITRSLIWSVLLLFMFLPWQYFARDFPIPGVIYSYAEMLQRIGPLVVGDNRISPFYEWMVYARFLAWPALGVLALVVTAERYRAGVMIAIGHPLQSILQPRPGVPQTPMGGTGPRPLAPPPPMMPPNPGPRP